MTKDSAKMLHFLATQYEHNEELNMLDIANLLAKEFNLRVDNAKNVAYLFRNKGVFVPQKKRGIVRFDRIQYERVAIVSPEVDGIDKDAINPELKRHVAKVLTLALEQLEETPVRLASTEKDLRKLNAAMGKLILYIKEWE